MPPVRAERERLGPAHRAQRQLAVEMREQRAAARRLPFERRPERVGRDRDEHQVALAGEVFCHGFRDLVGGGKMDVAVGEIDRGAGEFARAFSRLPRRNVADFVDRLRPGRGTHRQLSRLVD